MVPNTSIILTYQHSSEREPLFYACLSNLSRLLGNDAEICVHEVGPKRHLELPPKYKYLYTPYSGIFHRAWALNRGVKKLSTGSMLVLMDSDLIVSPSWAQEILTCKTPSIAWQQLKLLDQEGTKTYLGSRYLNDLTIYKTKHPSMGGAAGGAMIIPRELFYSLKGIPEDFLGSWGGEDNVFWAKLIRLGYKLGKFNSTIYHLHHSPSTPRITEIQRKAIPMLQWKAQEWKKYIDIVGDSWGSASPQEYKTPGIKTVSNASGIKLTIAMLSWLRYEKLLETLNSLYSTLTIPINLTLMVQGEENLTTPQRREVRTLANKFAGNDLFFTKGNIGTGPARKLLLNRALNHFHTPYINLGDDDTTYTPGSIENAIKLLDKDQSIGVCSIRYKPRMYKLDSQTNPWELRAFDAIKPLEDVDCTGSASAFIRRDVFDLCSIDPYYSIGNWDLDLFLQIRSIGWRIVNYQKDPSMQAINNWGGCKKYKAARMNRAGINRSVKYFKEKWVLRRSV